MTKLTRLTALTGALGAVVVSQAVIAGDGCNHAMRSSAYHGAYAPAVYQPAQAGSSQYGDAQIYLAGMGYKGSYSNKTAATAKADIVDTAIAAGSFNTLVTAIKAAGLVDTLKGKGPFTVFAPTDAAFAKLPEAQLQALLGDKQALTKVLTYHVVAGKVTAADVVKLNSATTVEGQSLSIKTGDAVMVNNARVIKTDISSSNGIIHVIDSVVLPPDMLSIL